jgi:signal transduction histidine kinase
MFKLFAELIAFHLDAHAKLAASDARLHDERRTAELREQFIAVLGHDLRNPLASISAGATLLHKAPLDARNVGILALVQSSVDRMAALIDNVLDFARGRLGGGLSLNRAPTPLQPVLAHVVAELRSGRPGTVIDAEFDLPAPVDCDPGRLSQLLSNLLANALTHGADDAPVRVRAAAAGDVFELSVANSGEPIPPATMEKLFEPFERGAVRPSQQGLGLGLYIASEIAHAHGGALSVASSPKETRFTFRMPLR